MAEVKFVRKRILFDRLVPFGFEQSEGGYTYAKELVDGQFTMQVSITDAHTAEATVTDNAFGEEYVLHLVAGSVGGFVGQVRDEYNAVLLAIEESCCEADVFKSEMAKKLIEYVRGAYGDELEYLWDKFPDNAVWRRKDNEKWYGAILTVSRRKLGLKSDERVEIIDLRIAPDKMDALIDNEKFFPGWHMNKKHWYTVILDGSVAFGELCRRIDESYILAKK